MVANGPMPRLLPRLSDDVAFFWTSGADGVLRTSGGRVLAVSATGADLAAARSSAYELMEQVQFDGMRYRRDIAAPADVAITAQR